MTNAERTNNQTPLFIFFFLEWTESFNSSRREPLAFEGFNLDDFLRINLLLSIFWIFQPFVYYSVSNKFIN